MAAKKDWRVEFSPLPHLPISEARHSPTGNLSGEVGPWGRPGVGGDAVMTQASGAIGSLQNQP
jgi:hypothetical protein